MPNIASNLYRVFYDFMEEEDQLIVVENDSVDHTKSFLKDFTNNYGIDLIYGPRFSKKYRSVVSKERALHMSKLRNIYLDRVKMFYPDAEYMIVFDSDMRDLPVENFDKMFTGESAVTSNGVQVQRWRDQSTGTIMQRKIYYDSWAYQHLTDDTLYVTKTYYNPQPAFKESKQMIEVRSGFGGLAVYLLKDLKNCKYEPFQGGDLCEHAGLHSQMRKKNKKIWIQTNYQPVVI